MPLPKVGTKAPAFAVPDETGKVRRLSEFAGKWVLLYFYPKDDTPGCTIEACTIRDQFKDFKKIGAVVADGGLILQEADMRTMRSKKFENLYVIGDLLHITRPSGGYSLQLCWTSGYVAGMNA